MGEAMYIAGNELFSPGCGGYEPVDVAAGLSSKDQRKTLTLVRWIACGWLDITQATEWSDERRRRFIQALPETFVGIEDGV